MRRKKRDPDKQKGKQEIYTHLFSKIEWTQKTTYRHCIMRIIFRFFFSLYFHVCCMWSQRTDALFLLSSGKMKWQRICVLFYFQKRVKELDHWSNQQQIMEWIIFWRADFDQMSYYIEFQWRSDPSGISQNEIGYGTLPMTKKYQTTEQANKAGSNQQFFFFSFFVVSEIILYIFSNSCCAFHYTL